ADPRRLPPFPTRRSSDLFERAAEPTGASFEEACSTSPGAGGRGSGPRSPTTVANSPEASGTRTPTAEADRAGESPVRTVVGVARSEEHTSELQSRENLVC